MNRIVLSFVALTAVAGSAFAQGVDFTVPGTDSAAIQTPLDRTSAARSVIAPISSPAQSFDSQLDEEFLQVRRDEMNPRYVSTRGDVRAIEGVRVPNNIGTGE